jgi:PAS domain S-box-containing protein
LLPRGSGVAVIAVSARATDAWLLAAVLENSSDAVVFVDAGGMVSRWNGAAEKMFGFSLDGASTSSFEKPFPPEWREEIADVLVRASLGQSARATAVAVRSDGSRLIVETTCPAVTGFNGAPSDYVVLLKDVTEPILVRASATAVALSRMRLRRLNRSPSYLLT